MTHFVKIFIILATATAMLLSIGTVKSNETSTQIFCAYGHVFVEFNEGNHKWGTIWLDRSGRPVPCKEDEPNIENYLKGNYNESV